MSVENTDPLMWVYDYVVDANDKIVAINYHQHTQVAWPLPDPGHPDCLAKVRLELLKTGLTVAMSGKFQDRESAMAYAWTWRDRFDKGLD